jgi:hypothetical protein
MHRVMECNGFFASIMRADKVKNEAGELPPGMPIPVLPVDYLKDRPDFWVGGIGSYVCPVDDDWALWFNWSMNINNIAVLTSVKGMNPITGQRIEGLGLEQYKNKCPIHKKEFKHGRFCSDCNFKWPDQNYVSSPNALYWDGFRSADGKVQQFYFTEDMSKSVPELVIGRDDTVPAFGFCFYTSKNHEKPSDAGGNKYKDKFPHDPIVQVRHFDSTRLSYSAPSSHAFMSKSKSFIRSKSFTEDMKLCGSVDSVKGLNVGSSLSCDPPPTSVYFCNSSSLSSATMDSCTLGSIPTASASGPEIADYSDSEYKTSGGIICAKASAEVGIGAGATINQALQKDARDVDEWKDKPAGIMRIYFVFREQFEKYAKAGLNDLTGCKSGYLEGLPVGGTK